MLIRTVPTVVYALYFVCNPQSCSIGDVSQIELPAPSRWISVEAIVVVLGWIAFQAIIYAIDVGKIVKGTKLRDGNRLEYRINAFFAFVASLVVYGILWMLGVPVSFVYDQYLQLTTVAVLVSVLLAVAMYAKSFGRDLMLAEGGNSGNIVYDFFVGRELNPRIGRLFDIKVFCELRPGLIGWVLLNFGMMAKQKELYGEISNSMYLICAFQFIYVMDGLWFEESILTTMDIIHDGFGFMLAFGDLAWVPFTYTLQARYLVDHPVHFSNELVAIILALEITGLVIFRGANSQKDGFRRDPKSKSSQKLKTLETKRGTKLIISGFWGFLRHPNYTGDILMALAWCMCTGFNNILPYFYVIYFTVLLIHRESRDEHQCRKKYGSDWDKYCSIVKYRMFPLLY